jgi:hypothetical protein
MNILFNKAMEALLLIYALFIGLTFLFDRSFVGIMIYGYQLGKMMVGASFLVCLIVIVLTILKKYPEPLNEFSDSAKILSFIFLTFILSLLINGTDFFSSYTFKSSSYIWVNGYLFLSVFIFTKLNSQKKLIDIFIYALMAIPFVHYFFSTGYYPNFIMDVFIKYSDKFTFNKASDIMISLVSINLIVSVVLKNKLIKLVYAILTTSLLLPLLLLMSRGSFLSALFFIIGTLFIDWRYLKENLRHTFLLTVIAVVTFIGSTYNVGDVNFDFNLNFGSEQNEESLSESIQKIAKKNNTRKAFLSFYFQDGRIYSVDNTTNWRLDIWQDVIEDMNSKNLFIKGYGYNEIIPVMLDPSAPGRLGRDGLNENVHNYFINILARGGIVQLLIFILFHCSYLTIWYKKFGNLNILVFFLPVMINSSLDITMEGVQFPFIYYSMLGILYNLNPGYKEISKDLESEPI